MGRFVIDVREIDERISTHSFDAPVDWLESTLKDCEGIHAGSEPGHIELTATKRGKQVMIKGGAQATLAVNCVRCLEDFAFPIEAEVEVLMVPGPALSGKKEREEDDLGIERFQGDLIHLDELIRDSLILEVPMNPNCGDTCPGWDGLSTDPSKAS